MHSGLPTPVQQGRPWSWPLPPHRHCPPPPPCPLSHQGHLPQATLLLSPSGLVCAWLTWSVPAFQLTACVPHPWLSDHQEGALPSSACSPPPLARGPSSACQPHGVPGASQAWPSLSTAAGLSCPSVLHSAFPLWQDLWPLFFSSPQGTKAHPYLSSALSFCSVLFLQFSFLSWDDIWPPSLQPWGLTPTSPLPAPSECLTPSPHHALALTSTRLHEATLRQGFPMTLYYSGVGTPQRLPEGA